MKLIIHSDDYGMTNSINDAVIELCKAGVMSSTSIMANMPYTADAVRLLGIPNTSLGVHAAFTQGKSIENPQNIPSLVDADGNFYEYNTLVKRIKKGKVASEDVYKELKAQYKVIHDLIGDELSFIDSHHGMHNKFRPFQDAFLRFGKETPGKAIRTKVLYYLVPGSGNKMQFKTAGLSPKKLLTHYYFLLVAKKFAKSYKVPDGMIVGKGNGIVEQLKKFHKIDWNGQKDKTLYIVSHPSKDLNELENTNLMQERVDEYNYLLSPEFRELAKTINFTNFAKL